MNFVYWPGQKMVTFSMRNMIIRTSECHLLHPLPRDRIKKVSHSWQKLDDAVNFQISPRVKIACFVVNHGFFTHIAQ